MRRHYFHFLFCLGSLISHFSQAQSPAPKKLYLDLQVGSQYAYAEGGHFSGDTQPFKRHLFILKFWPGALLRYQATPRLTVSTGYTGGATGWGSASPCPPRSRVMPSAARIVAGPRQTM